MTYKIFEKLQDYNDFTLNGTHLTAGTLYLVKENKSLYFLTNNIDGEAEKYEYLDEIPEGYIKPEGNIIITENGEEIDITQYATASVDVPIPEGYIIPTGNKTITANGENIDVNDYATATVNVDAPAKDYIVESVEYDQAATYTSDFYIGNYVKSVKVPDGITGLEYGCFQYYPILESLTFTNSVTKLGQYAFGKCTNLKRVNSDVDGVWDISSITRIDKDIFDPNVYFPYVETLITSNNVDKVPFGNCTNLKRVNSDVDGVYNIPDTVNYMRFSNDKLESINIPSGPITFMRFYNCTNLKRVNSDVDGECIIPSNVTSTGDQTFQYCSSIERVTIPNSVTSIGNHAFEGCTSLTNVTIGTGVTSIGYCAFKSCTGLTSITIPSSVTSINFPNNTSEMPFYYCSSLTSMIVDSNNTVYDSRDNCNAIIETATNELKQGCKNSIIPNSVTSIGRNAFGFCEGLTTINIPDSVTSIGVSAFTYCSNLTSVTIGTGVTSIGSGAFEKPISMTAIESVTILATTPPTIGSRIFGYNNPTKIYVPAESVEAYKTATNWSSLASRIQAIA